MKSLTLYTPAVLFVLICILLYVWQAPFIYLEALLDDSSVASYVIYITLLASAVVFVPITIMPIIPMASVILGPFTTGVLSIIGWTLGAVIAFLIARNLGRPVLEKFIPLEKLDQFSEKIPKGPRFMVIVLLRLTLPVDLVSYVIGLSRSVGLLEYTLATLIGVSWFSFAFAYMGEALFEKSMGVLIAVGSVSLVVFMIGWYALRRSVD